MNIKKFRFLGLMKNKTSIYRRAFAFAYVLLIASIFCGCEDPRQQPEQSIVNDLEIVVLDSCEYILFDRKLGYAGSGGICHKQNCKFCAVRNIININHLDLENN